MKNTIRKLQPFFPHANGGILLEMKGLVRVKIDDSTSISGLLVMTTFEPMTRKTNSGYILETNLVKTIFKSELYAIVKRIQKIENFVKTALFFNHIKLSSTYFAQNLMTALKFKRSSLNNFSRTGSATIGERGCLCSPLQSACRFLRHIDSNTVLKTEV